MAYRVPFVDPRAHYRNLKADIDGAIISCLERGELIYRQELKDFEAHLADYVGTKHAVGLNSGYHALEFALRGAGIGPGDEVITVAHTFLATASAIVNVGATPVLIDVREDYNMDPDLIEPAITGRTRALLPVHLNGRVCEMGRIQAVAARHDLVIVEDAAQALGATFEGKMGGSFSVGGCFSFYPFKALGGFGDGGALTTDDDHVARVATLLRYNGEDRRTRDYHYHGYTAMLDNVQAAVLDVKLCKHFSGWVDRRRRTASLYREALAGVGDLRLPHFDDERFGDSFQNYVIRTTRRDELRAHLTANGVETLVSWPKPMWSYPALELGDWDLPETVAICNEVISLPMSAETTDEHVEITAQVIKDFFAKGNFK